jgi:PAS domain S-box-containing protein
MIPPVRSGDRVPSHGSRLADGCGLALMALGLAVMAGWWLGIDPLKRVMAGLASMKFNTALGFLLAGGALYFRGKPALRGGLAAAVGLLGALTLVQYFSGLDFGIDQLFIRAEVEAAGAAGRMSGVTALCFFLSGVALALLGKPRRTLAGVRWAEALAIGVGVGSFIALLGYALGAQDLYSILSFSSVALHTAAGFFVLAAGILCAVPEGIVGLLRHVRGTGRLLWLGFGVLTALLIVLGVVSVSQLRSIAADVTAQAEVARPRAAAARELKVNVLSYSLNVWIFFDGDAEARVLAEDDAGDVARYLADYERLAESMRQRELAARFTTQWRELNDYGEALMAAHPENREGLVRLASLRRALEAFLETEMQPEAVAAFEARRTATQAILRNTQGLMLLLLVCGIVLALVTSGAVVRAVLGGEAALRESAERFRTLFESLPIGATVIDPETLGFVHFNRATAENLGYPAEEFARLRLSDVEAVHDEALIRAHTQRIAGGEAMNFESKHRTKSGELRDVLVHGRRFEMGGRGQALTIFMDITERKQVDRAIRRLNEELELRVNERTADLMATNKELEAFSYSVSHDLRSPLRAVDGFSQMVLANYAPKLDAEGRRMLGVIRSEAQRMGRLVDDLLAFFRLGRQPIESAPIDMHAMARDVFDELAALEPTRQLRLDQHPLPPARGTAAMIRQVWVNLIGNALKFTKHCEVAEIEIGVKDGEHGERIYYVKDNGVGFDMRHVDKLFGVFHHLHSQQEFPGTGVGLALVQRIVQRHGGRVWAEAEVDRGATFYFTLPNP